MPNWLWKIDVLSSLIEDTFDRWKESVWARDPDERYCCDGRMCGCGGQTIRDAYSPPAQRSAS